MSTTEIETSTESVNRQEQILSAVRKGHEVTLKTLKVTVDRVAPVTTKIPAVSISLPELPEKLPFAEKLPFGDKIPSRDEVREYVGKIPSRETVVSNVREFAGQLLAEQRKFNGEVRKTAATLRPAKAEESTEA